MPFLQICVKLPNDCFQDKLLMLTKNALNWRLGEIFDAELKNNRADGFEK